MAAMTDSKQCHAIAEDPRSAGNVGKAFRRLLQLVSPVQSAISVCDVRDCHYYPNLFNKFEDVFQSALERLFVDGVIAR